MQATSGRTYSRSSESSVNRKYNEIKSRYIVKLKKRIIKTTMKAQLQYTGVIRDIYTALFPHMAHKSAFDCFSVYKSILSVYKILENYWYST